MAFLVYALFGLVCLPVTWHLYESHNDNSTYELEHIFWCAGLSFISMIATLFLIPKIAPKCLSANLFGRDINKNGNEKV